jgi:hypothetical protein
MAVVIFDLTITTTVTLIKKLFLLLFSICLCSAAYAQIEVVQLQSKGFSATGFGAFLNLSLPVTQSDAIIAEGAFYYFKHDGNNIAIAPLLAGYRRLLNDPDYGFYVEPVLGYSFGATDIQKMDAADNYLFKHDGNELDQMVTGATAGLGFGYLFEPSGPVQFNISIRYEHTFVSGDPSLNVLALRISHSFSFGRRD